MNKKVLIFIDWYRPGYKAGGPVTSVVNLVEQLGRDFQFHILTRNRDHGDHKPYEGVATDKWVDRGENVRVCYLSRKNLSRKSLIRRASEAGCETWFITGIYSWYFSILPMLLSGRTGPTRVIISTRGMFSSHALAVKGLKKRLFIRIMKLSGIYRKVTFHATNDQEKGEIQKLLGNNIGIHVAPNLPSIPRGKEHLLPEKKPGVLTLLNLGRISPEKNTLAALRILKLIGPDKITSGHIHLHLAGHISDPGYWKKCMEVIDLMPPYISIEYHGPVHPDHLPRLLQKAHVLFLPTTGENYGHAIIECMFYGLPAIISDRTPWNDLDQAAAGRAIPLDREDDTEQAILDYLQMNQDAYNKCSYAAVEYARKVTGDPVILGMNRKLFLDK